MTADHLADVAVVVGVGSGRSHPVTWAVRGGPVRRRLISIDAGTARPRGGVGPDSRRCPPAGSTPPPYLTGPYRRNCRTAPVADIGSVVVVPLPGHGLPAGAIILLRRSTETAFTQEEEAFARLFAARAAPHCQRPACTRNRRTSPKC